MFNNVGDARRGPWTRLEPWQNILLNVISYISLCEQSVLVQMGANPQTDRVTGKNAGFVLAHRFCADL